jgi:hypothetical protein
LFEFLTGRPLTDNSSGSIQLYFRLSLLPLLVLAATIAHAMVEDVLERGSACASQPLYFSTSLIILGFVHFLFVFDLQQLRFGGLDDRGLVDDKILKVVDLSSNFPG